MSQLTVGLDMDSSTFYFYFLRRQSLTLLLKLECNDIIVTQCNLKLLSSSDPSASASQVVGTTDVPSLQANFSFFLNFVETRSPRVAQASLKHVTSSNLSTLAFKALGLEVWATVLGREINSTCFLDKVEHLDTKQNHFEGSRNPKGMCWEGNGLKAAFSGLRFCLFLDFPKSQKKQKASGNGGRGRRKGGGLRLWGCRLAQGGSVAGKEGRKPPRPKVESESWVQQRLQGRRVPGAKDLPASTATSSTA